jgi:acyl-CoA reductase-like NAD-dependent aldehyde dehydrogenase
MSQNLLSQRWDYIFFTGSVPVGKIVAQAAQNLLRNIRTWREKIRVLLMKLLI